MSTGQASRACLLNSALRTCGVWCESTAFRHSRARSSKRAGGFIPRIALDECRDPEHYRTRAPPLEPTTASHSRENYPLRGRSFRKRSVVSSRSIPPAATASVNSSHSGPSALGSIPFKRRNTMHAPSAARLLPSTKG